MITYFGSCVSSSTPQTTVVTVTGNHTTRKASDCFFLSSRIVIVRPFVRLYISLVSVWWYILLVCCPPSQVIAMRDGMDKTKYIKMKLLMWLFCVWHDDDEDEAEDDDVPYKTIDDWLIKSFTCKTQGYTTATATATTTISNTIIVRVSSHHPWFMGLYSQSNASWPGQLKNYLYKFLNH